MTISFDIPPEIEAALKSMGRDPSQLLREAALVELYRQGHLTHYQLAQALGLTKLETDSRLKALGVYEGTLDSDDLDADRRALDRLFKARS
jgi:hypothetical protein